MSVLQSHRRISMDVRDLRVPERTVWDMLDAMLKWMGSVRPRGRVTIDV